MSFETSHPFTRAEALAAGLTDVELRSRRFQRLFHGLYMRARSKIGVYEMTSAALHICPPGSYASHETAAALWGASVGDTNEVHVTVPTESRLRMLIVLGGLPEPQPNHILRHQDGEWAARLDLCYPGLKLIIEYDGRHHTAVRTNWLSDITRREALEGDGWRFVIVTSEGLYDAPLETLQRVRLALAERGCQVRSRRIPAEWHRIFTDRPVAA
jgi:hypothetical protein